MRRTFALIAILAAAGCGGGGDKPGVVRGEVTLDGKPLASGLIRFVPSDGKTGTADAKIVDGRFVAEKVPPGAKRVEISAAKVTGRQKAYDTPDSPVVETTVELLPAKYNVKSELTMTVKPGEQDAPKFELTSK
ncbi:MAG: hypothetical protein U0746_08065 [Gemmataceae bacterium]